jgi:ATP-binding cassette subfamily B protein
MFILWKSLYPYFVRYRWMLWSGLFFLLISNILSIYPAQIVRDAFDYVGQLINQYQTTKKQPLLDNINQSLIKFAGLLMVLALIRGVFLFFVRQTLIVMSRYIEYDQKNQLFDKFQQLSLNTLRRRHTGDLLARINEDVGNVRMFTGPGIMYTANTISLFTMVLITMLLVNLELTLYTLAPLPLMAFLIYQVHSIINRRSERAQRQLSILHSIAQETFAGIRLIRAHAREQNTVERFSVESDRYKQKVMHLVQVDALFYPLIMLLVSISTIFTIWIGSEQVIAGTLSVGIIAEFVLYINLLIWPVAAMGWVTSLIQRAAASQQRINEVLALESEVKFPAHASLPESGDIIFENVSYTHPNTGIQALKNISFSIRSGQTVGIIGATGSGKTTLASLLVRFIDTQTGYILLGGKPITDYSKEALRTAISLVPQDVFLFSTTIAENIAFGLPGATTEQIHQAARFAGVYDDIIRFPQGFDTIVGERGVTLSGGQKQRISIARAFIRNPKLLILDDSLSAVDTRTEELILHNLRQQFQQQTRNATVILISHRVSCVQQADVIFVLEAGVIVESGSHAELIQQKGKYATLFQQQQLEAELREITT